MSNPLDELVAEVLGSAKYWAVSAELVRSLAARELAARRSRKEAVKAVKNKLHQVGAAYLDARPEYDAWLAELERAAADTPSGHASPLMPHPSSLSSACLAIMRRHASTRERLPILVPFYAECLAGVPPPRSVLDLACGLNPLAIPWMPLAPGASYHACDIFADMVAFVARFLELAGVPGGAAVRDLTAGAPETPADLALVLKTLPVLEQVDRDAPLRLLRGLRARHILVSFPAQSLGGRGKGMADTYERRFLELIAGEGWGVRTHRFQTEIAFLLDTHREEPTSRERDTK
jgi:16S rRNA (guanine(1405)-N(7))-methyltransferase